MTELHVLRVFLGPDGGGGNPLGIFLDGSAIEPDRRLAVAHDLGGDFDAFGLSLADKLYGAFRAHVADMDMPSCPLR